jgi:branched-chain amino acid transport system ATP-binding protein
MLEVTGITRKFGELVALKDVSFMVEEGECLGIIGPNGAGKTTLFNIISGFLKPNEGDVKFDGISIVGKKPSKLARMGLVRTFQIVKVFKNMSVEDNVNVVNSDVSILKYFGLWAKRHELAGNLSHGELRKLSIALALAANPKVLLLDEPFSGLSPAEAKDLAKIIRNLSGDGVTQIVIEHRLGELFGVSQKVLVLNSGSVIFEGDPKDAVRDEKVIQAYLGRRYSQHRESVCVLQ